MSKVDEIRERWASRKWPTIGYFVHGQAYEDIHALLAIITMNKQADYDSRPDGSGLDDGPELPLSVVIATKRPMIIAAYKEGLSARACARVFGVSHDTAASIVRREKQAGAA